MSNPDMNIKAHNFSPFFWWEAIERATGLTHAFGEQLAPGCNFKQWLRQGCIEHDSLEINIEPAFGASTEFREAIKNDYFYKVSGTSIYGRMISEKTFEDLHDKYPVDTKEPITFLFKISDMNHFISVYLQQWLIFDTYYYWVRWQLYFDFIVSKLDTPQKELFMYFWTVIFHEIEFSSTYFKDIAQYKKFRDQLDTVKEQADYVEKKILEIRNSKA